MTANSPQVGILRLHVLVLAIVVAVESIGSVAIPLPAGHIILLPLLFAFFFGMLLNPYLNRKAVFLLSKKTAAKASSVVAIAVLPFAAKFGAVIGPFMEEVLDVGGALLAQELGNLGSLFLSMPIAVLFLGMGREAIGACFSIGREPSLGIISDRYGLKSAEGVGLMGVYVMGVVFGTVFFSIVPTIIAGFEIFDFRALAMACGIGSASMMAACSSALSLSYPSREDEIFALAATSNLLSSVTGIYMSIFIAIPLAEALYLRLTRVKAYMANRFRAY